jgi:hypothetical protein
LPSLARLRRKTLPEQKVASKAMLGLEGGVVFLEQVVVAGSDHARMAIAGDEDAVAAAAEGVAPHLVAAGVPDNQQRCRVRAHVLG